MVVADAPASVPDVSIRAQIIDQSPQGCRFHTRCPLVMDRCREVEPPWRDTGDGHFVACHLYE